jgi:phosphatidate cytidylyltransferase
MLSAYLLALYSGIESISLWQWLVLSIIVVISSTFGDLFESALKRSHGLKDSGNFMPGHGGILDRIDSLLFAMPMAYLFFELTQHL